jgi:hypothetical protein
MPSAARTGFAHKIYRNDGTFAAPTWVEVNAVGDVKIPLLDGEANVNTRATRFKQYLKGLVELKPNWSMPYDPGSGSEYLEFETAAQSASATLDLAFADGDITTAGTKWIRIPEALIFFGERDEPLEGAVMQPVTAAPKANATNQPSFNTTGP